MLHVKEPRNQSGHPERWCHQVAFPWLVWQSFHIHHEEAASVANSILFHMHWREKQNRTDTPSQKEQERSLHSYLAVQDKKHLWRVIGLPSPFSNTADQSIGVRGWKIAGPMVVMGFFDRRLQIPLSNSPLDFSALSRSKKSIWLPSEAPQTRRDPYSQSDCIFFLLQLLLRWLNKTNFF